MGLKLLNYSFVETQSFRGRPGKLQTLEGAQVLHNDVKGGVSIFDARLNCP